MSRRTTSFGRTAREATNGRPGRQRLARMHFQSALDCVEMSGFATRCFDDPLLATTARMSKGLRRDRGLRLPAHSRKGPVSGLGAVGTYLTEVVQIAE